MVPTYWPWGPYKYPGALQLPRVPYYRPSGPRATLQPLLLALGPLQLPWGLFY